MSGPAQRQPSKERIRGPYLETFITKKMGLPFEEALRRADAENRVIASNRSINWVLFGEEWESIREVFPCVTGTMTAYVKPGEKFGKAVESLDERSGYRWVFPVPKEHQDKTDAILVAEHPEYSLESDRNSIIVSATQVDLVERFPAKNGWYLFDVQHGIPAGDLQDWEKHSGARFLFRTDTRVSPVVRSNVNFHDFKYRVFLTGDFAGHGVAVEAGQEEVIKKASLEKVNQKINLVMLYRISSMRNMLREDHTPEFIFSDVKANIDLLVNIFMLCKKFGEDTSPFVSASNALGYVVTKELANDPRYKDIVPELKKYYLDKLREVQK